MPCLLPSGHAAPTPLWDGPSAGVRGRCVSGRPTGDTSQMSRWAAAVAAGVLVVVTTGSGPRPASGSAVPIHAIQHVVVIMQENRSFDSYFGTFPGAAGIPMRDGVPTVCVPDPQRGGCL